MSGAGRKHRAKHLTRQYLDAEGWLDPKEGESLAVCLESPHGQHLRVLLLCLASSMHPETTAGAPSQTPSSSHKEPQGGAEDGTAEEHGEDARLTRQLVFLPGKFHKVIWLSIKDVVVVADGSVVLKPSPEQLANFLKRPENAEYKELVEKAQAIALGTRVAMERAPLHMTTTATTTSALPIGQTTRAQEDTHEEVHVSGSGEDDNDASDADSLDNLVNPNRANIRHRQQYFYVEGEDEDGEEEADEEEEEGTA